VAAFIGEPVQGAGGVIVPPSTYWPEIQRICTEVRHPADQRRGDLRLRAHGQLVRLPDLRLQPDLITFAKGVTSGYIPLGGVMVGERVAKVLIEKGGDFNHGYTYSGHPVACAVGLANIGVLQREGIVQKVHDETGPYLAAQFASLATHPLVGEVQTCGLMGAVQFVQDKATNAPFPADLGLGMLCRGHCFGNGLVMRAVGDRMIVAPPLVITRDQIDEMMVLIRKCLDLTLADTVRCHP
jgi:putrescine aminotransferase